MEQFVPKVSGVGRKETIGDGCRRSVASWLEAVEI